MDVSSTEWGQNTNQRASGHMTWMWIYFWASTVASGFLAGNLLGGVSGFSASALFGGLIGGALAAIPVMVIGDLLVKLLAAVRANGVRQVSPSVENLGSQVPAGQPPVSEFRTQVAPRPASMKTDAAVRATTVTSNLRWLDDPRLVQEARVWMRQGYGRDLVAGAVERKAVGLGLEDIAVSADDIPEEFRK